MDTFTVSFEYKKHDGSTMHFATNIDQPTFGSLLKNKVFDDVPSLNMFKNQVETDISRFAEPKKKTIAVLSNTDGGNLSAKKRGRPPKSKEDKEEVAAVPKKRGRPPKNVQQTKEEVKVPKKRGRPPKNALLKQLTLQNSLKKTPEKTPESSSEKTPEKTPEKKTPSKQTPAKTKTPSKKTPSKQFSLSTHFSPSSPEM
jgi:hypothetical protein